jgi:citrate lyase subunit beta / citryl-CoA lyase
MTSGAVARSCPLVVPAHERTLAKATGFSADELVIDLEDAVPPAEKTRARELAGRALAGWPETQVALRVNAPGTPWCHSDLIAAVAMDNLDSVVIPKVQSAADLAFVDRLLDGAQLAAGRTRPLGTQALIETPAGLQNAAAIASSSARLEALVLGYADLGAALGRRDGRLEDWLPAQEIVLAAARSVGIYAIDGPHLGVEVDAEFERALEAARRLGFDGKWSIHPSQLEAVREAFTPGADDVRRAERVLHALARAHEGGRGAVTLDGEMIDAATVRAAERVLARTRAR